MPCSPIGVPFSNFEIRKNACIMDVDVGEAWELERKEGDKIMKNAKKFATQLHLRPVVGFSELLLPDEHEWLSTELAQRQSKSKQPAKESHSDSKWQLEHLAVQVRQGLACCLPKLEKPDREKSKSSAYANVLVYFVTRLWTWTRLLSELMGHQPRDFFFWAIFG